MLLIERPFGPCHQIHTSRKIHASASSQAADTLNRGIAGLRADLSVLNSRDVGNLNTVTPCYLLLFCREFLFQCFQAGTVPNSDSIMCNPVLKSIRYCCCAS